MFFTNKKFIFLAFAGVMLFVALIFFGFYISRVRNNPVRIPSESGGKTAPEVVRDTADEKSGSQVSNETRLFQPPLNRASERITKKKFGQYITPQNSPVQPERFSGYHTGTDFEIFPEELEADVPVKAVCDGKLLSARTASGYGGIAVQSCELDNEPVTILYGHLNIASVKFRDGDEIKAGDTLGFLGADKSAQTDGERKHLHLGFHKGSAIDIRGYVNSQTELSDWLNPYDYVCQ